MDLVLPLSILWDPTTAVTIPKHSFSSINTSVMSGLRVAVFSTQARAISTAFQAELASKSPCSLGSTMLLTSPFSIIGVTHSCIRIISPLTSLLMAGWPVISSSRIIPKLYMSLFLLKFPDDWALIEKWKETGYQQITSWKSLESIRINVELRTYWGSR